MIACCGLDCGKCPAYIATQKNDKKELAKVAVQWSKQFGQDLKPENVICDGCTCQSPRKSGYCTVCKIRICCLGKGKKNCAFCEEYSCGKLEEFFKDAPEAKENLGKIKIKV